MSILIKGMEMPQGNSTINVLIYADGTVYTGHVNDSRYSAVSVPTPHGRLIDADVLIEAMMQIIGEQASYKAWALLDTARKQPTIIEAEGSENEAD